MTRVLLLGPNGMLGTAIRECAPDDIEVVVPKEQHLIGAGTVHEDGAWVAREIFNTEEGDGQVDVIINAIGDTGWAGESAQMVYLNALWPILLADVAQHPRHLNKESVPSIIDTPVIHVSTDCVYGQTPESDIDAPNPRPSDTVANPVTLYGRTKLAGESERAINVRTSFVGPRHGLWKWFVDQRRADPKCTVDGWINAWWSGSTVMAVAQALLELARHPGEPRTLHLATEAPITKFGLLATLQEQLAANDYSMDGDVLSTDEPRIDRSLHPDIVLPPFADALREMVS